MSKKDKRWNSVKRRLGDTDRRRFITVWDRGRPGELDFFDSTLITDRDSFRKNPEVPEWAIPFNYYAVLP